MDIAGAEALRMRIAQQEQWGNARAVRIGLQPPIDPDGEALESFRGTTRYYRAEERIEVVDGRPALVVRRPCKHLVDGVWEDDVIVEGVERVA